MNETMLFSIALMVVIALLAHVLVAPGRRSLPMQWSLRGAVNWHAPRIVALAFVPVLIGGLLVLIGSGLIGDPAERQSAVTLLAILGPLAQLLHLGLIAWQDRRG